MPVQDVLIELDLPILPAAAEAQPVFAAEVGLAACDHTCVN